MTRHLALVAVVVGLLAGSAPAGDQTILGKSITVKSEPGDATRRQVKGSGLERFSIQGPGRVQVRIESASGSDWTLRDVLWPGKQRVIASRLMILDKGQTARGEKVVVYATPGQALKDTITALIHYPFG